MFGGSARPHSLHHYVYILLLHEPSKITSVHTAFATPHPQILKDTIPTYICCMGMDADFSYVFMKNIAQ